jgi:multidrug efflux pump subunit AcrA (membrane-fusion protein)
MISMQGQAEVVLVALLFAGHWPRHAARKKLMLEAGQAQLDLPRVKVVPAVAANGGRSLTLPGSLEAMRQALVNARATGYVARWRVGIGDRVRAGDVLAELDTPELDQQLQ